MKTKLLLIFISIIFTFNIQAKITKVKIHPKADFIGITKKNETYTKQSISKDPKELCLGWNTKTQTYGRGYLQFDLSSIPANVKITNAHIQLAANTNAELTNTESKIVLKLSEMILFAEDYSWKQLVGGPEIATCDISWGSSARLTGEGLKAYANDRIGRALYLSLHLAAEGHDIRLYGDNDLLYLWIEYDDGQGIDGISLPMNGPEMVPIGSSFSLNVDIPVSSNNGKYRWHTNQNVLSFHDNYEIEGVYQKKVTDSPEVSLKTSTNDLFILTTVHFSYSSNYNEYISSKEILIIPNYQIRANKRILCNNETFSCTLYNLTNIEQQVEWMPEANATLISGQGSPNATFIAHGNGKVVTKVKITYPNSQTYTVNFDDMWVGKPQVPIAIGGLNDGMTVSDNYRLIDLHAPSEYGAVSFSWNIQPRDIFESIYTTSDGFGSLVTKPLTKKDMVNFYVELTAHNSCGSSSYPLTVHGYIERDWNNSGPLFAPNKDIITNIETNSQNKDIKSIKIYDISGILIYSSNVFDSNLNLNSLGLDKNKFYIMEKTDFNDNIVRDKIIIK